MSQEDTTLVLQHYLESLRGEDTPPDSAIRDILERSLTRLRLLCGVQLYRDYRRLTRPPFNLETEEMLGAVVARLHNALRKVRPKNVRIFFALVNKHIRWELNDLVRRLDEQKRVGELADDVPAEQESGESQLSPDTPRILLAIEQLPKREREVFSLVRIQGMTHVEAANLLGVATKTIQRSLNSALLLLAQQLADLRRPSELSEPD